MIVGASGCDEGRYGLRVSFAPESLVDDVTQGQNVALRLNNTWIDYVAPGRLGFSTRSLDNTEDRLRRESLELPPP